MGPLVRRLEEVVGDYGLQCLVVGRWAEGSQHLHDLVQKLQGEEGLPSDMLLLTL